MNQWFILVLNNTIAASWLILAVLLLRILLQKAPKWVLPIMWGIVAIRLVIPFHLTSMFSLIPNGNTIPADIEMQRFPQIDTGVEVVNNVVNPVIAQSFSPNPLSSANPLQIWMAVGMVIWLIGIGLLLLYALLSYALLHGKVSYNAEEISNDLPIEVSNEKKYKVYECKKVGSPFILGIFFPKIYLPENLQEKDKSCVLRHEFSHLKRGDHFWKPLGFLILSVYWFNPLCWLAYYLLCKDIEFACDEKVTKDKDNSWRADYCQALLNCSVHRKMISACPVAFGEVSVKQRITSVLNYKRPAFWIIIVSVIVCIVMAVCFLTNPVNKENVNENIENNIENQQVDNTQIDSAQLNNEQLNSVNDSIDMSDDKFPEEALTSDSQGNENIHTDSDTDSLVYEVYMSQINGEDAPAVPCICNYLYDGTKIFSEIQFADDCKYYINPSMERFDKQEVDQATFISYLEDNLQIPKLCQLSYVDNGKTPNEVNEIYLESIYSGNGIEVAGYWDISNMYELYQDYQQRGDLLDTSVGFYAGSTLTGEYAQSSLKAPLYLTDVQKNVTARIILRSDRSMGYIFLENEKGFYFGEKVDSSIGGDVAIFVGHDEELGDFLLKVHLLDEENSGQYYYYVYRPEDSRMLGFAGSMISWGYMVDAPENNLEYENWKNNLIHYLDESDLLLSTIYDKLKTGDDLDGQSAKEYLLQFMR